MSELKPLPDWFAKHTENKGGINHVGFFWILNRPESVQKILLKFPPACVVRIRETGDYGVHLGVIAGDSDFPTLRIGVEPGVKQGTEYMPAELEPVGYWNGATPEVVASILDEAKVAAVAPRNKTGRNEPCPCNSGRKRKHCHGDAPVHTQPEALQ